ncbi:MAG: family 10 glycosylhydrolase [Candidatus Sumerlaeota bacterium]|nr:family 10 glycosylhydrolase [Candidatus Sumerlaeota bacterium]
MGKAEHALEPEDLRDLPPVSETRAVRYEIARDATAAVLEEDLTKIAQCGFNTVIVSAFRHGHAFFPSESLKKWGFAPIHPAFRKRDPLSVIFRVADRLGLNVLGHAELLNVGSDTDKSGGHIVRRKPEWMILRRALRGEGLDEHRLFLDPGNEKARRLIGDVLYELVEKYPVSGIYLNDLRYPRSLARPENNKYARDLDAFLQQSKTKEKRDALIQPAGDAPPSELFQELLTWRAERLSDFLRYLHCRLERANARIWIVTQAVGPFNPNDIYQRFQGDWETWVSQQYVDGAAPAYRSASPADFRAALSADMMWMPDDRALYPLLEAEDLRDGGERVEICRESSLDGVIFHSFRQLEPKDWETLSKLFRRPARPAEEKPYLGARWALGECKRLLSGRPDIADFFGDLLKVLPAEPGPRARILDPKMVSSVMGNLLSIQRKIAEGAIPLDAEQRQTHSWIGVARRRLALALRH